MAKYSFEFKKKIVKKYLDGEGGRPYLATKYGVASGTLIRRWIQAYKVLGDEGLMRSRKNKKYSFNFKMNAVELYLTSDISYSELANALKINNPTLLAKWINDYRTAGPDALKPKKRGRKKNMADKKNKSLPEKKNKENIVDLKDEKLRQLEKENLRLRIQNAYLKELRRLLEEEENPQN